MQNYAKIFSKVQKYLVSGRDVTGSSAGMRLARQSGAGQLAAGAPCQWWAVAGLLLATSTTWPPLWADPAPRQRHRTFTPI